MLAHRESAALAQRLIAESCRKQHIEPDQLTLHADRGSSMRSKPVALLLSDLGVTKTHSRPYVSNDNPYSESQFKTLKYCPQFPNRFGSAEDGRLFCGCFFGYYNYEHRHSGIGLMTPADVHYGRAEQLSDARREILLDAQRAHPERFVRGRRRNFTGESFWARGYFVSTVGLDEEMVRKYIRDQEKEDQRLDQLNMDWSRS